MPDARALFEEFAAAYARGERPSAREYVERADDPDALAALIERFLEAVPARGASDDDLALVTALAAGEPPLLVMRVGRGLRVDQVVDTLMAVLKLEPAKRAKVKRYYQRLEGGLLDPRGVSERVWSALADLVPGARDVAGPSPPAAPAPAAAAYYRADVPVERPSMAREPERDEVDALFTAGADQDP